jgi:tetratricopeptide (TPR) repeat protein
MLPSCSPAGRGAVNAFALGPFVGLAHLDGVSLWDRIRGALPSGHKVRTAQRLELRGDLEAAAEIYLEAGLGDEAARLLLLRADAERSLERRMVLFERAAASASDAELARKARARRARLAFDLVRAHGSLARSELAGAAEQLEDAGEHELAAEAYRLLGDTQGELRALTAAGAIDKLEDRLRADADHAKREQAHTLALRKIVDLDRSGERKEALRIAAEATKDRPDERIEDLARSIRQRIVRGPLCDFVVDGRPVRIVLGDEVTVGRGEASLVIGSRAVSREHLKVKRDATGVVVAEDLGTRNGTFLRGARLAAPVPVGAGLELTLGTDVRCRLQPGAAGAIRIEVAGLDVLAPLGPFHACGWSVALDRASEPDGYVVLESTAEAPAFLGELLVARRVELASGDAFSTERAGPARLSVGRPEP